MEHIKQHIEERLWNFIKRSYNSEDYKNAILDSIQFLGDIIREKSGLDNDGNQLVGAAFGGQNPKIKLNKLKTESEKNIQKGIESILRGLYSAYRNPRSHSKVIDSEQNAFEIILFINHLLKLIDKSKGKFSTEIFLKRVFDKDFVQSKKYASLLVKEIPKNKVYEVAVEIFRQKEVGKINNLKLVWDSLKTNLTQEDNKEILNIVSEELRFTDSLKTVIRCIALFKEDWNKIDEDSRLRAENKIIQLIPSAEKDFRGGLNEAAVYSSWIRSVITESIMRDEIADNVHSLIDSEDEDKLRFAFDYFGYHIPSLEEELTFFSFKELIKDKLGNGNKMVYEWISKFYDKEFRSEFKKEIEEFVEVSPEDNLPF